MLVVSAALKLVVSTPAPGCRMTAFNVNEAAPPDLATILSIFLLKPPARTVPLNSPVALNNVEVANAVLPVSI